MKYLTVIRHAKTSWEHFGLSDHDRPINERGQTNAVDVARFLAINYLGLHSSPAIIPPPERMVASSARRTQQTARIMQEEMKLPAELVTSETRAYLAEAPELMNLVREFQDDWKSVMLFAHNNGISHFVDRLLKRGEVGDMSTCATAILELPTTTWKGVEWRSARLIAYITPKLIAKRFPTHELPAPHDLERQ